MIRCIVIDDEPLALKQLISYAEQTPELELVASCQSAREALEVLRNEHIDAMFVDINMPDLNGLDFVRSLDNRPMVVFTTAYSQYAIEGFQVNAIDYLLKPFGLDEFRSDETQRAVRAQVCSQHLSRRQGRLHLPQN